MDPGRSSGLWFVLLLTPSRRRCVFHPQPVAFREVRPHSQRRDRKGIAPFSLDPSLFRNCLLNVDTGRAEVKSFLAHLEEGWAAYRTSPAQRNPTALDRLLVGSDVRPATRATAGRLAQEPPRITLVSPEVGPAGFFWGAT